MSQCEKNEPKDSLSLPRLRAALLGPPPLSLIRVLHSHAETVNHPRENYPAVMLLKINFVLGFVTHAIKSHGDNLI